MNDELRCKILKNAISLEKYMLNDLVWSKEDAEELIFSIMNDNIGILGGDVYKLFPDHVESQYANWWCAPEKQESSEEFNLRSKEESLRYIKNYNSVDDNIVFSIVFNDNV